MTSYPHYVAATHLHSNTAVVLPNLNPHNLLLHWLSTFGFSDSYVYWLRTFLPKTQFLVPLSGISMSCFEVLSHIAQGNVIGPFLLNIVIYEASLSIEYIVFSPMKIFVLLNYQMTFNFVLPCIIV